MTVTHRHFNSSSAFASWASEQLEINRGNIRWHSRDDYLGSGARAGVGLLNKGEETYVDEARQIMHSFQEHIEVPYAAWEHDLMGGFPDVPAYLSGDPENMWTRVTRTSDRSPLRVWVGLVSSMVFSHEQIRGRGLALAAFALSMVNVRPVIITPYLNGHNNNDARDGVHSVISWDIATSPLVLSELVTCLSDFRITRMLGKPAVFLNDARLHAHSWPFREITREHVTQSADDLWLGPMIARDPIVADPVKWIKAQLAKYGQDDND